MTTLHNDDMLKYRFFLSFNVYLVTYYIYSDAWNVKTNLDRQFRIFRKYSSAPYYFYTMSHHFWFHLPRYVLSRGYVNLRTPTRCTLVLLWWPPSIDVLFWSDEILFGNKPYCYHYTILLEWYAQFSLAAANLDDMLLRHHINRVGRGAAYHQPLRRRYGNSHCPCHRCTILCHLCHENATNECWSEIQS